MRFFKFRWKRVVLVSACVVAAGGGAAWATVASSSAPSGVQPSGGYSQAMRQAAQAAGKTLPTFSQGPGFKAGSTSVPGQNAPYGSTVQVNGIDDSPEAPFPYDEFRAQNVYYGSYLGQRIVIYAGEVMSAPTAGGSGVSVVGGGLRIMAGGSPGGFSQYLDPGASGWLRITGVEGSLVSLARQDGTSVTFDLSGHSFSS